MYEKPDRNGRIVPQIIEQEMKQAYVDYAMSVIVGRALPDVRDGLKPVHRRILYAMNELGMVHTKPHKKCARIVGEVLGKFHPHGDIAVYDALVRMAQDFSMRHPLVDGQGNFGCFTGDTKIALTDGRGLSFKELVKENKEGKKNYAYTVNKEGLIEIAEIKSPRLTKKNAEIMKVVLDNGEEIKCTLDHRFMLRDGQYKEARFLKIGESLMPLYSRITTRGDVPKDALVGYLQVFQPNTKEWIDSHRLADEWNIQRDIYDVSNARVRHHVDFNKLNNNPSNIKRLRWADHWRLHAQHAAELHKNPAYRQKLDIGRKKYWADARNRDAHSKYLSIRNKENWRNEEYRENMQKILRKINVDYIEKHPEIREKYSKRLKALWVNRAYRAKMSELKSREMKQRWENKDSSLRKFTSNESKKIWSNPNHRQYISNCMKTLWKDNAYRNERRNVSLALWQEPEYRSKYAADHFRNMANSLWSNSEMRELHRKKAKAQWENKEFRERFIRGVQRGNRERLLKDPLYMERLAKISSVSLRQKWQDPKYKQQVVKSRILRYVNQLKKECSKITPEVYEQKRHENWIPTLKTALKYFDNFNQMIEQVKLNNHKVVLTEILSIKEDVYDLTIEETHNFALASGVFVHNSIDGDSAASMRYTEARLQELAEWMLADIEKETVNFKPNFDDTLTEPTVLPSKVPNILINGSTGIAVGMATNVPPHNLKEVCGAVVHLIENPEVSIEELMRHVPGPDFPTGAVIAGRSGILQAYKTGRGKVTVKAVTEVQKDKIIVTEIPYMINKSQMIEEMADLVRAKRVEGIRNIRDESNREGIRVVIELKSGVDGNVVLNQLFTYSKLKTTFGIIFLALVDNQPRLLNLKSALQEFVKHRQTVVRRRTAYDLKQAQERAHILEGLIVALDNVDDVVQGIKKSKTVADAQKFLVLKYSLTELQAKAILELRLQKLATLEQQQIRDEHKELIEKIKEYQSILASEERIFGIIKKETLEVAGKFADGRRTRIEEGEQELLSMEELIEEKEMVVTVTHTGYVKRIALEEYKQQRRGGKGITAAETKDEDWVERLFVAQTHDYLLCFTTMGQVHWLKVYEIPEASRYATGKPLVNLVTLVEGEKVTALVPVKTFEPNKYIFMTTAQGVVKKTPLESFSRPRRGGIRAITLEDDRLIGVEMTDGTRQVIIATKQGMAVRFDEEDVRAMGRNAAGVRGIRLKEGDVVVGMEVADETKTLLTVTNKGYGKRTELSEYRLINRGGSGVTNINLTDKNGLVVGVKAVTDTDELMFVSKNGVAIRITAKDISVIGRSTQGVRVMRLDEGDELVAVESIAEAEGNENP